MTNYVGRFAPSPTGPLHFGSLVAALASWLDARAARGRWLVRIDDIDKPRVVPGAAAEILAQLRALGLRWDGEVERQTGRCARYDAALERLRALGTTYPCACSRREIADSHPDGAQVYPGTCSNGLAAGRSRRSVRLRTTGAVVQFEDRVQGMQRQSVEDEVGDFVLWRTDGQFAYQLAVVVDDADQGVTDVVRGADLLDSTPRQIFLQRLLGLPSPRYLHVPVAVDASGQKLSKQTGARSIDLTDAAATLRSALAFLGQSGVEGDDVAALLESAVRAWSPARISAVRTLPARS